MAINRGDVIHGVFRKAKRTAQIEEYARSSHFAVVVFNSNSLSDEGVLGEKTYLSRGLYDFVVVRIKGEYEFQYSLPTREEGGVLSVSGGIAYKISDPVAVARLLVQQNERLNPGQRLANALETFFRFHKERHSFEDSPTLSGRFKEAIERLQLDYGLVIETVFSLRVQQAQKPNFIQVEQVSPPLRATDRLDGLVVEQATSTDDRIRQQIIETTMRLLRDGDFEQLAALLRANLTDLSLIRQKIEEAGSGRLAEAWSDFRYWVQSSDVTNAVLLREHPSFRRDRVAILPLQAELLRQSVPPPVASQIHQLQKLKPPAPATTGDDATQPRQLPAPPTQPSAPAEAPQASQQTAEGQGSEPNANVPATPTTSGQPQNGPDEAAQSGAVPLHQSAPPAPPAAEPVAPATGTPPPAAHQTPGSQPQPGTEGASPGTEKSATPAPDSDQP